MRAALVPFLALAACAGEVGDDVAPMPDAGPPPAVQPARYPTGTSSPLTASVVDRLRAIRAADPGRDDQVFMKVGDSATVDYRFLDCFAGAHVELDGRDALVPTLEHFGDGVAADATPWDRASLAAQVGRTAAWCIGGAPSPLDQELDAISPRFAVVSYGTNDMEMGTTHRSALWGFHDSFETLLDQLEARGVIPIVTGMNARTDLDSARLWVPTYDAVLRALAERRQLPFLDLLQAVRGLPQMGLGTDGVHSNAFVQDGAVRPCVFTADGLGYGYNARNLLVLEGLDAVRRAVLDEAEPDPDTGTFAGDGVSERPFVVDRLPFSHHADTTSAQAKIPAYPACGAAQDEGGPEIVYRLELAEETPLRIIALDRGAVDVDVHLLAGDTPDPAACLDRDHRIIERTLPPGVYHIVVDSFVDAGGASMAGQYTLVVLRCEPGDPDCAAL